LILNEIFNWHSRPIHTFQLAFSIDAGCNRPSLLCLPSFFLMVVIDGDGGAAVSLSRGTIGTNWGDDCSNGSFWAKWHSSYRAFLLHYAHLAQSWGIRHFVVTHELYIVNEHCGDLLNQTVAALRLKCPNCQFTTVVTRRPNGDPRGMGPSWYWALDYLSTDYYPSMPVSHPELPWQSYRNLSIQYSNAMEEDMYQYGNLSEYFGHKPILVTEYGFQSQPFAYSYLAGPITGNNPGLLTVANCDILDQCVALQAQTLAYDLSLRQLYAQPWFKGVLVWLWRSDPTHGGSSGDEFSPAGKPSSSILNKWWTSK